MNDYQIPRNSLAWMLIALAAVVAPHLLRLPSGIIILCASSIFWRVMVFQGRWSYPGRWIKAVLVFGGVAGLGLGYGTFLGLDPWVGLLIMMSVLKLLEMHNKRDAHIVILLSYFVVLTEFLYEQGIPYTLYMYLCVTMITAALVGLNQTRSHLKPWLTFKKAALLLAQSLPLMIVLFVLFPRIPPLWSVPLQSGQAITGVTDRMTPGNIAQLTQSDGLAFRATFEGEVPLPHQLYWRGLVLSRLEGDTWMQEAQGAYGRVLRPGSQTNWQDNIERLGQAVSYTVILEPTNQNWLFSLTMPEPINKAGIGLVRDFRFFSFREIRSKMSYDVTSWLSYRGDVNLTDDWRRRYTLIPGGSNPRTRELARSMRESSVNVGDFVRNVLRMYKREEFVYTLKTPILGEDPIDEFLIDSRRGFCEHYAGSFVFMMRSVGIPARVIVGYQGGEYNRIGNYVEVRQYDAHAWAEIWQEGSGWLRVDPTSAVAPNRIERGLESALENEDTFLADLPLSWLKYRQSLWLTEIRLQLSAMSHYWDTWVVGYTPKLQLSFLRQYFGDISRQRLGIMMLTAFFSILAIVALAILHRPSHRLRRPADREYLRYCEYLSRRGFPRNVGEGPLTYFQRMCEAKPGLQESMRAVTDAYLEMNYIGDNPDKIDRLRQAIRSFRLRALMATG